MEKARQLGARLLEEAPVDLRVNLSRTSREEVAARLESELKCVPVQKTPWSPLGLRFSRRKNLGLFTNSHPGWIEMQDEGSQIIVLSTDPRPEDVIIDCCAGAGGKTLAFLDLRNSQGGTGEIHACDVNMKKLEELRGRIGILDSGGLSIHCISPHGPIPAALPSQADLVLVDAPCSGSGTLRRNPELRYRYSPEDVIQFALLQGSILRRFAGLVRPGGRLVYTTCSLFQEENDAVVDAFLREREDFCESPSEWASSFLPPEVYSGSRIRLDPLSSWTDGFFLAKMVRVEAESR